MVPMTNFTFTEKIPAIEQAIKIIRIVRDENRPLDPTQIADLMDVVLFLLGDSQEEETEGDE